MKDHASLPVGRTHRSLVRKLEDGSRRDAHSGKNLVLTEAWFGADRRDPEWRRRTLDEIEALFSQLGLTSDFWRLRI